MIKQIILILATIFCLFSCNISSNYYNKNTPLCSNSFEISKELIFFIKNKEFKEKYRILKSKHGAIGIRLLLYIKSKNIYYCEIYKNNYTIKCLLVDKDMDVIMEEQLEFEWVTPASPSIR